jgi:hypothetical protein
MENSQKNGVKKIFMGLMIFFFLLCISGNLFAQTVVKELEPKFLVVKGSDFTRTVKEQNIYVLLNMKGTAYMYIIKKTGTNEEARSFSRQITQLVNAGERQKQRLEELVNSLDVWLAQPIMQMNDGSFVFMVNEDTRKLSADLLLESFAVYALAGFYKQADLNEKSSMYGSVMQVTNAEQLPLFEANFRQQIQQMKQ